ncbi:hypothetical protein QAD02_008480 [Eretmocerus hayati]|uniref:Uncharacterized protein n=1 Tax=Eretmocerus hayati TaxID=131215 RepID=A0ACC2N6N2_9HYME|nr:hypothetical protein QAD02_008480 [Eretmocerus hayati]
MMILTEVEYVQRVFRDCSKIWAPVYYGTITGTRTSRQESASGANSTSVSAECFGVDATLVSGRGCEPTEPSLNPGAHCQRSENALDALLDELQTFSQPASQLSHVAAPPPPVPASRAPSMAEIGRKCSVDSVTGCLLPPNPPGTLRRLHSYPSGSDTDTSPPTGPKYAPRTGPPRPPTLERGHPTELLVPRRAPPPPPRTSSRSPLASPTSPRPPPRLPRQTPSNGLSEPPDEAAQREGPAGLSPPPSNSSSCESVDSQEGALAKRERQELLEQRHQELLRKQKALQEQYARLQQLQRNASTADGAANASPASPDALKKTGSESNLLAKIGLGTGPVPLALPSRGDSANETLGDTLEIGSANCSTTVSKVYETEIL